jgi:hypothetical protein
VAAAADEPAAPQSGATADVLTGLARIAHEATTLRFTLGNLARPAGGHVQGIQMHFDPVRRRHVAFLSHDSQSSGYLLAVEFPANLTDVGRAMHVHVLPTDGQSPALRHAGGFQLAGDILAIGLEDNQQKTRSEVQFWDVAEPLRPTQLTHLSVRRSGAARDQTAGAVGLVDRKADHLLAVGNWDSRAIDFYVSNGKPLGDARCRFAHRARFAVAKADTEKWKPDRDFASYQSLNLVVDSAGKAYLMGFATTGAGHDVADLFAVELDEPPARLLRKLARKSMRLAGSHFVSGGGLWIDGDRMAIVATPRNLTAETPISLAR